MYVFIRRRTHGTARHGRELVMNVRQAIGATATIAVRTAQYKARARNLTIVAYCWPTAFL